MPTRKKQVHAYQRDKRSPEPLNETVSRYMSSNRSKNTRPEFLLRQALWTSGIRGYRLHWKKAPGKPDLAWPGRKIAIFINGCFWHRCPTCNLGMPKHNADFWRSKFERNVQRDREKTLALETQGWQVLVIWECELKNDLPQAVQRIRSLLNPEP